MCINIKQDYISLHRFSAWSQLVIDYWSSCRAALCASQSWTLPLPGSSGSQWRCRSSCRLCGTPPSAGGPDGTGCAAAALLRRSWTCSYHGNWLHFHPPHPPDSRGRGGNWERDWCLFFFMRKNWSVRARCMF